MTGEKASTKAGIKAGASAQMPLGVNTVFFSGSRLVS